MRKRKLGNTDMEITRIGFGAWAIGGGGWEFGWGPQDDQKSIAAIHKALDEGINWIDTAAAYGLGHSEEVVARALKGMSERPYVFSKCGLEGDAQRNVIKNLKADFIRREIDDSLRRLQVDRIDLYQIHWPTEDLEEGWGVLADAQKAGKLRWIGVSNFDVQQLETVRKIAPVDSVQPPYSMLFSEIEKDVLPYCQRNNIGVIVYSPMASGLLTGTWTHERLAKLPPDDWRRKKSAQYQEPAFTWNLKLAELLKEIGNSHGRSAGEVAIAWTLRHPAVTAAIVGARSPQQVEGVVGGGDFELNAQDIARIEAHFEARADDRQLQQQLASD
jgi:aryl-alcohol dehydrogenase-like predicted oxidoreductase